MKLLKKKRILLIEDETNLRETLSDLLGIYDYEVIQAVDGRSGLKKALEMQPDIILCDVNMPKMSGFEVLEAYKKSPRSVFAPFIFLTAKTSMEELREGMELGADDYLIKPVDHQALIRTLRVTQDKYDQINRRFEKLQNQLEIERLKSRGVDHLNSHEVRRKLSIIQSLFPLIRTGELSVEDGLQILEESGEGIELAVRQITSIIHGWDDDRKHYQHINIENVRSIWLIDDDATQNFITKKFLLKVYPSFNINSFCRAERALDELIDHKSPDLIFLDISMPGMNGFSFLKEITNLRVLTPVIMLSSSISPDDIRKSLGFSQVQNYLSKPLTVPMLRRLFYSEVNEKDT